MTDLDAMAAMVLHSRIDQNIEAVADNRTWQQLTRVIAAHPAADRDQDPDVVEVRTRMREISQRGAARARRPAALLAELEDAASALERRAGMMQARIAAAKYVAEHPDA